MSIGTEIRHRTASMLKKLVAERRDTETELGRWRDDHGRLAIVVVEAMELLESLSESEAEDDAQGLRSSVRLMVDSVWERLPGAGVTIDGCVGESFDPSRHHCVERVSNGALGPNQVVRVEQRGIICHAERIRRARVVVNEKGKT